jgi:hypothetical protein
MFEEEECRPKPFLSSSSILAKRSTDIFEELKRRVKRRRGRNPKLTPPS